MRRVTAQAALACLTILSVLCFAFPARGEPATVSAAVEQALAQNPSLRAAVLDLRAANEALRAAQSLHRPSLQIGADGGHRESLSATMSGVAPNADDSVGVDVGLSYASKVGTEVSVDLGGAWRSRQVNRDPSTTANIPIGSNYGLDATVAVSQPLLRGAGSDIGEADIRTASLSRTAAEHARDAEASELIRDVLCSYWELWYAQQSVEVNRAAAGLAEEQLADAEARVGTLGTLARIDALRFASELAAIEEQLTQAEADRRGRAVELGRLMGVEAGASWAIVASSDLPAAGEASGSLPSVGEVVEAASRESSELRELAAELEVARDRVIVARDGALPRLDLTASFAVGTLWNDDTISTGELPNDRPALSGQLGLELELPLGNARAHAEHAQARLLADAAEARLEAQERRVRSEAVTLLDSLRSARRRAELAARSVAVARQLAAAEQEALRLGTSTALQLLEAQGALRETELRHLRALVDQTTAQAELRHLSGRLLGQHAMEVAVP